MSSRRTIRFLVASTWVVTLGWFGESCTRQQAVSSGTVVAEILCAVLLEPGGTEREICDTATKLVDLLNIELQGPVAIPSASASSSSTAFSAPPSSRPRLVRLYWKARP